MFPVKLLAFVFISSLTHDRRRSHQEEEVEEEEESESRKYDVILRRGDVLQVSRTLVTHFGIYLGRDRVVHFIPDILPVFSSDHSRIRQTVSNVRLLLGVLLKRGSVRVNSVDDLAHGPRFSSTPWARYCSARRCRGSAAAEKTVAAPPSVSCGTTFANAVMFCTLASSTSFRRAKVALRPEYGHDTEIELPAVSLFLVARNFTKNSEFLFCEELQTGRRGEFCKTLRKLLLSRRVAKATAMLSLCLLVQLQPATISCSALLLLLLLPFILWMAS
ncbi:hypothetical protein JOB18_003139 [Solea senegalensis]|uniref:LRAT domain-containing protein n=1 Tax=Solea senegalensis TaxID=28829 RepID=A0AAV6QU76_SOLSE|nr:hypothetical protein JOB18_003139 [Solea senegalensis]